MKPRSECVPGDVIDEYGTVLVINPPDNRLGPLKKGRCTMTPEQAAVARMFGWVVTKVFQNGLVIVERNFERQG